ncbi:pyridoxamine 5'-phosphate oxidase family protein [Desertivirga brevis]|uniref:pyridoxamine 5'-phosphate oxidase family protein n=1 Tax=Desertivirga brevis TaxID=2810310 RepID=UPI001A9712F6|nr:pyridoxamine 5'-phosphate oxidase family protein [Pedobacter sp. SYSU D00873]
METARHENIEKFRDMVDNLDIAILSTYNGTEIKSRPMATTEVDNEGNIWFFTDEYSGKVDDVESEHKVSISYSDSTTSTYVVVNGSATVVTDRAKMEKLFNSTVKAFFPKGVVDPRLALLKIKPYDIEYWTNHHDEGMLRFMGILGSSPVADDELHHGEHGKINL